MKVSNHYSIPASKIGKTEIHLTHLKNPLVGEKKKKKCHIHKKPTKKHPLGKFKRMINGEKYLLFQSPSTSPLIY